MQLIAPSMASEWPTMYFVAAKALQDFVKQTIAPYKYPREIAWRERLPRTETGKLQRFKLREEQP